MIDCFWFLNLWNSCSVSQSGDLTKTDRAVDGIFGFGQQAMSVVTQLSTQGITPAAFSHCLRGDDNGGGVLVLGSIVEPGIVYTPLVPSMYVPFFLIVFSTVFSLSHCFALIMILE